MAEKKKKKAIFLGSFNFISYWKISILFVWLTISLFRHALINSDKKNFLKTIRYELMFTPAYLVYK